VTLGFGGFRGDAAYKVPAEVWRALTGAGRAASPEVLFRRMAIGIRASPSKESVLRLKARVSDLLVPGDVGAWPRSPTSVTPSSTNW
jgi:hypothetical protein